jgi:hypothetical protein
MRLGKTRCGVERPAKTSASDRHTALASLDRRRTHAMSARVHRAPSSRERQEAKMLNESHNRWKTEMNRCAACGGKFGLVRYNASRRSFCTKRCRDRVRARDLSSLKWLWRAQPA